MFTFAYPRHLRNANGKIVAQLYRSPLYMETNSNEDNDIKKYAYIAIDNKTLFGINYTLYVYYMDIEWYINCINDSWFSDRIKSRHPIYGYDDSTDFDDYTYTAVKYGD